MHTEYGVCCIQDRVRHFLRYITLLIRDILPLTLMQKANHVLHRLVCTEYLVCYINQLLVLLMPRERAVQRTTYISLTIFMLNVNAIIDSGLAQISPLITMPIGRFRRD